MPSRQRATLKAVLGELGMARFKRKPKPGLIHHSDRGSQYCNHDYQAMIADIKATASMSRKGNCWDNARRRLARLEIEALSPIARMCTLR